MNHETNLTNYALELVGQYMSYDGGDYDIEIDDLSQEDQNELLRLYLELTDRALLSMLKNDCEETQEKFAQVTRNNIFTYYKKSLNTVLLEACDNFLYLETTRSGPFSDRDYDVDSIVCSFVDKH